MSDRCWQSLVSFCPSLQPVAATHLWGLGFLQLELAPNLMRSSEQGDGSGKRQSRRSPTAQRGQEEKGVINPCLDFLCLIAKQSALVTHGDRGGFPSTDPTDRHCGNHFQLGVSWLLPNFVSNSSGLRCGRVSSMCVIESLLSSRAQRCLCS